MLDDEVVAVMVEPLDGVEGGAAAGLDLAAGLV